MNINLHINEDWFYVGTAGWMFLFLMFVGSLPRLPTCADMAAVIICGVGMGLVTGIVRAFFW